MTKESPSQKKSQSASAYDKSVEQRDMLSVMAVVEQDMSMQAYMLEQNVLSFEAGNLDADSLRLNAPIDSALLNTVIHEIPMGKPFNQTITVNGIKIQYTAYKLPNGEINVGRIHPVS